jgi:hypothetical protein
MIPSGVAFAPKSFQQKLPSINFWPKKEGYRFNPIAFPKKNQPKKCMLLCRLTTLDPDKRQLGAKRPGHYYFVEPKAE